MERDKPNKSKSVGQTLLQLPWKQSDNVEFVRYCGGHFENGDH
jgi:hypothetical protein